MPSIWERLKGYLGLSSKSPVTKPPVIKNQNKPNDDILINTEKIIFRNEEEVRAMLDLNDALSKPYDEVPPNSILGEKRVGEYLVDTGVVSPNGEAVYTGIRVDITAVFKTTDEYNYDKYYRVASFSDVFIEDLSTINFGTQSDSEKESLSRIRRGLAMPRYTRTKLMYLNMLEVDSLGQPFGLNSVKVPALEFMKNYKIHL